MKQSLNAPQFVSNPKQVRLQQSCELARFSDSTMQGSQSTVPKPITGDRETSVSKPTPSSWKCKCPSRLNKDDGETSRMKEANNLETGRPTYVGTSKLASLAESLRVDILAAIPIPMEVSKHWSDELASPCSSDSRAAAF